MIASMTGFGRGSASAPGRNITIEIKSLNSKQLDLIVKMSSRYRELEGELRSVLASELERGKIETVVVAETTGVEEGMLFNTDLLKRYKEQIEKLDRELNIPDPADWHSVLFRMPDAMKTEDSMLSDQEKDAFFKALKEAAANLMEFRREEGAKLYDFFTVRIENIRRLLGEIAPYEEERVVKIKSRLQEQLEKLTSIDYDKGRLEQELIFYIEKLDVTEEKQRLTAHLDYFLKTMGDKKECDGSLSKGKKLGFIAQEMGREINTLGSKSNNAEMQIIVVKMKDELEQIKEQVLNVL